MYITSSKKEKLQFSIPAKKFSITKRHLGGNPGVFFWHTIIKMYDTMLLELSLTNYIILIHPIFVNTQINFYSENVKTKNLQRKHQAPPSVFFWYFINAKIIMDLYLQLYSNLHYLSIPLLKVTSYTIT